MNKPLLLTADNTVLVLVDVQVKLARVMFDRENLITNLQKLIKGAQALGVPVIMTEQYPQGLGPTIPEVAELLKDIKPVAKLSFSCCGDETFLKGFKTLNRKQVLIAGIEAHVCVYQTAIDLLGAGYEVQVVADAVSSRSEANKELALQKMNRNGAAITSTEMVLFELLKSAKSEKFKEISQIVK
ncbi:MAG: hydrolase [Dehalococcoidales bacterium]|nr:hydrolase [Dehalococcoidales bacterium]